MKNEMLDRIRAAIKSGPLDKASPKNIDSKEGRLIPRHQEKEDKVFLFKERAESSGARVHWCKDKTALPIIIKEMAGKKALALAGREELERRLGMQAKEWIPASCTWIDPGQADLYALFDVEAAITGVDLGIAETGSLVISTHREYSRIISLVAELHIALIWPDQIVSDLIDWTDGLHNEEDRNLPAGMTLITGPSKTADIELKLVVGVHGPAQLHLILVDED